MWELAIFWLACAAVFLELADRAPTLDEFGLSGPRPDSIGIAIERDAKIVPISSRLTVAVGTEELSPG
jgi:hypothetical protein